MSSNEGLGWIEIRIFVLYTKDQEVGCKRWVVEAAQVAEHQTPVQNVAGSNTSVSLRPKIDLIQLGLLTDVQFSGSGFQFGEEQGRQ